MINTEKELRLLVVNEQDSYCELLNEQVELGDFDRQIECKCVSNEEEAKRAINDWAPTLVVMDAFLEESNGFELMKYCNGMSTPVVVTSETTVEKIADSSAERGALAYIQTENDPDSLECMLRKIVEIADNSIYYQ